MTSLQTLAIVQGWPKLKNIEDVEPFIEQNIRNGADYIKLFAESGKALGGQFNKPSPSLQSEIIRSAHSHGLVAVAHAMCLDDTLEILSLGIDGLAHTFFDQSPTPELIAAYKKTNAWVCPTLTAIGSLTTEGQPLAERLAHDPRVTALLSEDGKASMCECIHFTAETSKLEYAFESVRQLHKAGIDIVW